MIINPEWLITRQNAPARRGSGLFASFLVTTLGVAVVMPGLLLQGVATRTRPDGVDLDEPGQAPLAPTPVETAEATHSGAANGAVTLAPQAETHGQADGVDSPSGTANGQQDVRLNRNGKPRRDRPELSQAERIARRRERLERKADEGDARPARPRAGASSDVGAAETVVAEAPEANSPSTALATVEPATGGPSQAPDSAVATETAPGEAVTAELVPVGPVTFEEIQAAHHEAAAAFREVKKSLNSAYTLIGRLNVERYKAEYELAEIKGLPLPERPPERSWRSAAPKPVAPPEAKRVKRTRRDEQDEQDRIDEEEVKAIARRRQRMVVIGLAVLGLFVIFYRLSGWSWFPDVTDRNAMTQIAGLGILMQAFFLLFFLFRLGTMTGRGKSWLFPTAEQEEFKRRRKRMRGH